MNKYISDIQCQQDMTHVQFTTFCSHEQADVVMMRKIYESLWSLLNLPLSHSPAMPFFHLFSFDLSLLSLCNNSAQPVVNCDPLRGQMTLSESPETTEKTRHLHYDS